MVKRDNPGPRAGFKDKRDTSNRKYYDDIKKEHYTSNFFSFKDSIIQPGKAIYKHTQRLLMLNFHPVLATTGADDGIATILTALYEQAHISGHMKDIGATELASAIDYCEGLWTILGQLRNEYAGVTLLDGPTFDDAVATSATAHRFWKPESFNTFIETLEARNLVVPQFLLALLDKFTGIRMELMSPYENYGLEIPGITMVMGIRSSTLANMEIYRNTMVSAKGEAIQFFNKFGFTYTSFTREHATKISTVTHPSPESYFWFNVLPLHMMAKNKAIVWLPCNGVDFSGGIDWSAWKIWFYKGQVSPNMMYSQLFAAHDATNNEYGGLFTYVPASVTEGNIFMYAYGIDDLTGTVINPYTTAADKWIPFLWPDYGEDDLPAAGEYELAMVGTELTANLIVHNDPDTCTTPRLGMDFWRSNKVVSKTALDSFLIKDIIDSAGMK